MQSSGGRERGGRGVKREIWRESMCGWMGGWAIGERKLRQRKGEGGSAKVFVAIECNKSSRPWG